MAKSGSGKGQTGLRNVQRVRRDEREIKATW